MIANKFAGLAAVALTRTEANPFRPMSENVIGQIFSLAAQKAFVQPKAPSMSLLPPLEGLAGSVRRDSPQKAFPDLSWALSGMQQNTPPSPSPVQNFISEVDISYPLPRNFPPLPQIDTLIAYPEGKKEPIIGYLHETTSDTLRALARLATKEDPVQAALENFVRELPVPSVEVSEIILPERTPPHDSAAGQLVAQMGANLIAPIVALDNTLFLLDEYLLERAAVDPECVVLCVHLASYGERLRAALRDLVPFVRQPADDAASVLDILAQDLLRFPNSNLPSQRNVATVADRDEELDRLRDQLRRLALSDLVKTKLLQDERARARASPNEAGDVDPAAALPPNDASQDLSQFPPDQGNDIQRASQGLVDSLLGLPGDVLAPRRRPLPIGEMKAHRVIDKLANEATAPVREAVAPMAPLIDSLPWPVPAPKPMQLADAAVGRAVGTASDAVDAAGDAAESVLDLPTMLPMFPLPTVQGSLTAETVPSPPARQETTALATTRQPMSLPFVDSMPPPPPPPSSQSEDMELA